MIDIPAQVAFGLITVGFFNWWKPKVHRKFIRLHSSFEIIIIVLVTDLKQHVPRTTQLLTLKPPHFHSSFEASSSFWIFFSFYFILFRFFCSCFSRARSFTLTRLFSFQINVKCVLLHMCGQFHTTDPNHMIKAINNVTILLLQICLNSPLVCLAGCWNFSFSHRTAPCLNETERGIKREKKTYTKYKWKRKHVVAFNALCIAEWWKRSADIITYLNLKMHKQDMNKMK